MNWQKSILQKDIIYYLKYPELSSIFTITDHMSDDSIQINSKFTFTVFEYIIVYEYILLFDLVYLSINLSINIYIIYIYIYIKFVFFLYRNIVTTYTQTGHTGFTFT